MDSLTHAALGAAIGEAILGRRCGNRAALWGAVAGTMPDFDVVATPFLDDVGFLVHHRGYSHSLLLIAVAAPLLGALFAWLTKREAGSFRDRMQPWTLLFFLAFLTHVILDACTTYGTRLLLPFSDVRVAQNNIFIIDPLVTLPLLLGVFACLVVDPRRRLRSWLNRGGLAMSCLYLLLTLVHQQVARQAFVASLAEHSIRSQRVMVAPTPLNSILWYALAEVDDGYYVGYYSLWNPHQPVEFQFVARNQHLLGSLADSPAIDRLKWFSDGYYRLDRDSQGLRFEVLKFGLLPAAPGVDQPAIAFRLQADQDGRLAVRRQRWGANVKWRQALAALWHRMGGAAT